MLGLHSQNIKLSVIYSDSNVSGDNFYLKKFFTLLVLYTIFADDGLQECDWCYSMYSIISLFTKEKKYSI